jgi:hypothetical protein
VKIGLPNPGALLPLKSLGLDPGRALSNANPTPAQRRQRRTEQFRYIVRNCAEAQQRVVANGPSLEAREHSAR